MKSLRRSLNSDKNSASSFSTTTSSLPSPIPLPSTSSAAQGGKVLPPQKVIRALASHKSQLPTVLSYQKGDFFYVSGELPPDENQPSGWYQALNPLTGSRGRVPRDDFEEFLKGGRATSGTISNNGPRSSSPAMAHGPASNYQSRPPSGGRVGPPSAGYVPGGQQQQQQQQLQQNVPRGSGGAAPEKRTNPLYAIVQYDFEAERPDELDAKAGEPIIVIAQSNHEWFVAKPIGRLGGPGLIPVSFVEIRDPVTSRPVENVQELLARGTIPQVEEWKKATAEYKASSIPLGRFDFAPNGVGNNVGGGTSMNKSSGSEGSGAGPSNRGSAHDQPLQATMAGGTYGPPPPREERSQEATTSETALKDGQILTAKVVSFHYEANSFWFRINATFLSDDPSLPATNLVLYRLYDDFYNFQITLLDLFPREAGRHTGDSNDPTVGGDRILPYMPGPLEDVNVEITSGRREELNTYLLELLALRRMGAGYILCHDHVLDFFSPGPGDQSTLVPRDEALAEADRGRMEDIQLEERLRDMNVVDNNNNNDENEYDDHDDEHRHSRDREQEFFGRNSGRVPSLSGNGRRTPSTHTSSRGESPMPPPPPPVGYTGGNNNNNTNNNGDARPTTSNSARSSGIAAQGASAAAASQQMISRSGDPMFSPSSTVNTTNSWGSVNAQPQSQSQSQSQSQPQLPGPSRTSGAVQTSTGGVNPPFIKIKVLDRTTDDMIAIRVPPKVTYNQLLEKIRDRLGNAVRLLQFRVNGGGGGFGDLIDDEGLAEWLRVEEKLVLYAE